MTENIERFISLLAGQGITMCVEAGHFDGSRLLNRVQMPLSGQVDLVQGDALWRCDTQCRKQREAMDCEVRFRLERGEAPCGNISLALQLSDWTADNYVLMPAAAYNGNRYRVISKEYPPFLNEEDGIGPDMPVTITDVPHLALGEGPSAIHLRSGDMATPAVAVFMPRQKKGMLLLFEPMTAFGYTGVRLEESADRSAALLRVEAPAVRPQMYTMANSTAASDDCGASFVPGDELCLRIRLLFFACADVPELFDVFFEHRKDMCVASELAHGLPFSAAYRILEEKFNLSQFNETYQYYMLGPDGQGTPYGDWQAGWCGGGMSSLALLYDGDKLSQRRANATLDSVFGILQHPSGFIVPILSAGVAMGDDFRHKERDGVLLVRKDGDVLLFAARHILLTRERGQKAPEHWLRGLRRLADAFVHLWDAHGQLGQFIDMNSGEISQGGTACGSVVPGGLALASVVLQEPRYLQAARNMAEQYYERHVLTGLLNGGPGEILQNPDSESVSNMLESFVVLYEVTGDRRWLPMAEDTACQCASWIVSYDFTFPAASSFGRLGMRTLGSVYANVQNKHSAPGFCTLSGASLLRLYRATGDRKYLEMVRETAHNITQYLSRQDRPIPTWDGERELPPGWMCERVNMSDWEGKQNIGGVFYGGCWCEVSCLLTYAEIPGVWLLSDTGEAVVLDHVDVTVGDGGDHWQLTIHNPTAFDAVVKLLEEPRSAWDLPWAACQTERCRKVAVPAGGTAGVKAAKAASTQRACVAAAVSDLSYNPG